MTTRINTHRVVISMVFIFVCGIGSVFGSDNQAAKRVITLSPHAFEIVSLLGAKDKIVGVLDYPNMPEAENKKTKVGGYHGLQIEKIISLKPDLVIAWESGNKLQEIERLESLGLPVYRSHPRRLEDIERDLIEISKRLGLPQRGRHVQQEFRQKIEALKHKYMQRKPVRVFYQMWHQPLRTINDKSWMGQFITLCGGKNIFADAASEYPIVQKEAVLLRDPEVILMTEGQVENENIWLEWPQMSAVKNSQFYFLPANNLHRATPRAAEGLRVVCEAIDKARQNSTVKN